MNVPRLLLLCAAASVAAGPVHSAEPAKVPSSDEVVLLSPFTVTGATSYNTTQRRPNFIYRYAEPANWNFSVTTRF